MTHVDHLLDDYLHGLLEVPQCNAIEDHCATCDHCRDALDAARRRLAAIRDVPPTEATPDLVEATLDRVQEDSVASVRAWRRRGLYALAGLAACVLVLLGSYWHYSGLRASPIDLLVLGQRDLLAETAGSLRVRLFDRQARTALASVPVSVELLAPGGNATMLAEFQTDAAGVGQPAFTVPDLPEGNYKLRVTARTPTTPEVVEQPVRVRRSWQVMLSTDKPIYQPGQTIHLRALALRRPLLKPVADQKATFTLTDPKGNVLFKEILPTSQFGLASVDCPLASEIAEGTYSLACKIGDSESRQPLPIQKYVLPKFAINLDFSKPFYQPGEELVCAVKVDYTTGKHVVGGTVTLRDDQGVLPELKGETDAAGRVVLRTRLPMNLLGQETLHLPLTCRVTDKAEQKHERHSQVLLTRKPLRIDLLPENGNLVAGVKNTIHILAQRADGSPAPGIHVTVEGQLEELTTDEFGAASFTLKPQGGATLRYSATNEDGRVLDRGERTFSTGASGSDFLIRTDKAVYQGGQTMDLTVQGAGSEPVMIDLIREGNERYTLRSETIHLADGKGSLKIDLNPDLVGTLALLAYRFGPDGVALQKSRLVQVLPASELKITMTQDRDEYKPAGEARLKFTLTADGKPCVGALSLTGVDEAVFALLPLKPGSEQSFFTLEAKALEAVTSRYQWSPVSAEKQTKERRSMEQAVFSSTAQSFTPTVPAPRLDEMPARGLPQEEFIDEPMPVKPTSPTASLLSLDANSFRVKIQQVASQRATAMRWIWGGWLLLGALGFGLGYAALWVFMPRREALALHAGFVLLAVPLVAVVIVGSHGVERQATFRNVGMAVGGGAMEERDIVMLPQGMAMPPKDPGRDQWEGGGRRLELLDVSQSMRAEKPRVRNYFPETLVWKPELVTDQNGEATLTLPLADSITTWRLSASAVDAEGHLGAREMPLKVFQPFFVDFNLPIALTRNDQVSIPVVVSSYLDKPQTVTLSLKEADWYELVAGQVEQKVDIQPGEVKVVHYRIAVRKAGSRQLEVMATAAGSAADAVRRPIEVLPDGRPVDLTASGSLESEYTANINFPQNAIDGSGKLLVKVYPSRFSQVVEGLDSIFQMPYGCFEQTSSTTYPNILALDYLQRTRQEKPEVAAKARHYIHLGYQRLIGFEVPGGGFDWFGHAPANLTLTAYGLMEFEDMARVHNVDPQLIERTRRWLLGKRLSDGSWKHDGHPMHSDPTGDGAVLGTTAYVAWAVFAEGRAAESATATRDYLLRHKPDDIKDPYTLALVANALLGIDASGSSALPYLERLEKLTTAGNDGQAYWALPQNTRTAFYGAGTAGNIETTALATLALIQGKKAPETVRRALAWLVAQKDRNGTWYSTQATVLSLRALLAAASKEGEEPKDRTILVKFGEVSREIQVPKEKAEVMQLIDLSKYLIPGKTPLEISEPTRTGAGFQVTYRYHVPEAQVNPNASLNLAVGYEKTEVPLGGSVQAWARVKNGPDQAAAMLLIEVPVPAGFTARSEDFAKLVKDQTIARYQIEGTRVLVYLREMPKNGRLEVPYTLEARQVVDTAAPGGRVYEYYDPSREAFGTPTRLRVTSP